MRETFPGYYRPSENEFKELWEECTFVLDANVLLNLYSYKQNTVNDLLKTLSALNDRLWVPYQAANEYQSKRLGVIKAQAKKYGDVRKGVEDAQKEVNNKLREKSNHPFYSEENEKLVKDKFCEIIQCLKSCEDAHPDLCQDDTVLAEVTTLLEGRVGTQISDDICREVDETGPKRYERCIPPGFTDKNKSNGNAFGDLILWLEIIEYSRSTKRPVVFVTDDQKKDWWQTDSSNTIGPHPELVNEFVRRTDAKFYMYTMDNFLKWANEQGMAVDEETITEVRELQKQRARMVVRLNGRASGEVVNSTDADITWGELKAGLDAMHETGQQIAEVEHKVSAAADQVSYLNAELAASNDADEKAELESHLLQARMSSANTERELDELRRREKVLRDRYHDLGRSVAREMREALSTSLARLSASMTPSLEEAWSRPHFASLGEGPDWLEKLDEYFPAEED